MNVIIKKELFQKLYGFVLAYESELNETVKNLNTEEEIDSMESKIDELQETAAFMKRIIKAGEHGREIKGQRFASIFPVLEA